MMASAASAAPMRASDMASSTSCKATPTVMATEIDAGPQLIGNVSG